MTGDHEKVGDSLLAKLISYEPVMVTGVVKAVTGAVLAFLVTHGVITSTQASSLTQVVVTAAVPVATLGLAWVVRKFVTPVAKLANQVQDKLDGVVAAPAVDISTAAVPPTT